MKFDHKALGDALAGQVRTFVDGAITPILERLKSVEDRPAPEDGKDGRDGRDGLPGRDGTNGVDGKDGADGERGFGLDDFDTELQADGRTILLKFVRGENTETREISLPVMIYRGVHAEAETYVRGDTVTWGGSLWHCDGETTDRPGEGSKAWTLAAKRGRDGKDGPRGEKGDPGAKGRDGRDLTQIGGDGAKW